MFSVEEIVSKVKEDGITRIEQFIQNNDYDINQIKRDTLAAATTNYPFGKSARLKKSSSSKSIKELFNNVNITNIGHSFLGKTANLNSEIFITHDYIETENVARNGFLHFDRYHFLKFFFYLTDVNENDGPLSVVIGSHKLGAELRQKAWKETHEYKKVRNRIFVDYTGLDEIATPITPLIGKAGDLFVFDTDVFHMGGATKNNGERLIIRGHTRLS